MKPQTLTFTQLDSKFVLIFKYMLYVFKVNSFISKNFSTCCFKNKVGYLHRPGNVQIVNIKYSK